MLASSFGSDDAPAHDGKKRIVLIGMSRLPCGPFSILGFPASFSCLVKRILKLAAGVVRPLWRQWITYLV